MAEEVIEKRKAGRPMKEIDWEIVKKLAVMQSTRDEISAFLEISHDALENASKRDFETTIGEKLKEWRKTGWCSLRRKQWVLADKSPAMAIFLGKQFLGQRDHPLDDNEFSGKLAELLDHINKMKPKPSQKKEE